MDARQALRPHGWGLQRVLPGARPARGNPGAQRRGRMMGAQRFLVTFCRVWQKVTRRKGEKVSMRRHRKWTMREIKTSTFPLFALRSPLSSVGINNKVNIHFRRWRLFTFPPLRRVTFCQTRQKVTKKRWLLSSGPYAALRGSLATGLLPGVRAAGPIHGASALDGHPCPSPPSAVPSLGLLKSQSAAPELSRA